MTHGPPACVLTLTRDDPAIARPAKRSAAHVGRKRASTRILQGSAGGSRRSEARHRRIERDKTE